jgi:hypothetical protein
MRKDRMEQGRPWVIWLRTGMAYPLAALGAFAAFGILLAPLWALTPSPEVALRMVGLFLAAAISTGAGGVMIAQLLGDRAILHGALWGTLLATGSAIYLFGPSPVAPLYGVGFGLIAMAGAGLGTRL